MNDYFRRAFKFIMYIALLFFIILGIFPAISQGKPIADSWHDLTQNSRFILMFGLLVAYGFAYPLITFSSIKRHLNGSFASNRSKIEKAFETLEYIKTEETHERIVYRKKSKFSRLIQWYEDEITVSVSNNPLIISGFRKWIIRIDRVIDQLIIKEGE